MDFTIIFLGLCAMTSANQQQLLPPNLSPGRPLVISPQFQPIGNPWASEKEVLNPQILYPSVDMSYPIVPLNSHISAIPLEIDQSNALDFGLPTVSIPDPNKNNILQTFDSSRGVYSSTVQSEQPIILPYQGPNLYPEPNDKLSSLFGYLDDGTAQLPSVLPSPYDLNQQYIPNRATSDKLVPEWSSMEDKIQYALNVLRVNIVDPQSETVVPWWDTRAEYTLLLGVVLELMELVAINGPQPYDDIFTGTVLVTLEKLRLSLTSNELAQKLVEATMEVGRASAKIRGCIDNMVHSAYCDNPSLCNRYIDLDLQTSKNQRLQSEKQLLLAASKLTDMFLGYYVGEFEMMAKQSMAYIYFGDLLRRGDMNELKPLVLAGAVLIKQLKELGPEQRQI